MSVSRLNRGTTNPGIFTSSTRPTAYAGMTIYETDTQRVMQHDGTGWQILYEPYQTWDCSVTPGSGTLTAYGVNAYYQRHRSWVNYTLDIFIVDNGTAGSYLNVTLPPSSPSTVADVGSGRETAVDGRSLSFSGVGTSAFLVRMDNTYAGSTGCQLSLSGTYQSSSIYF